MGVILQKSKSKIKKIKTAHESKISKSQHKEGSADEKINEVDYDEDVIEAANLAIAIQKEDYTTNIELSLACENLPRMDTFSQTDPMIALYLDKEFYFEKNGFKKRIYRGKWVELGKTEVIPETTNPKFMKTFVVSYNFEKSQKLKFEIYDIDSFQDKNELEKQDYIGFVETELHEIICSPTQSIYKPIINPHIKRKKNGILVVKGCEFDINSSKYVFKFSTKNVSSKLELFVRVYTMNENQEFVPVVSTDPARNSKEKKSFFEWSPIVVASAKILAETDLIRFELCEFNKNKVNLILGDCEINLDKILRKEVVAVNLFKNNSIIGQLHVEVNKIVRHTFLNYIYAGTEVSLIVGIDFSKSNKDSLQMESLHKLSENHENDYINALKSIVEILQYYDHDNKIPVYGFGARLPPRYDYVSQCFALNGNYFAPEVYGLEEVLNVYLQAVQYVKFHGPQIFNEILDMAGMYASQEKITNKNQKYYILLMITNGLISDYEFTYFKIKELSVLPLSIIIVGIGDGQGKSKEGKDMDYFSELQKLREIKGSFRNIVQFVNFNNVKNDREKIAKETLASVPKQFVEFMNKNNIEPMIPESKEKTSYRDFKQLKLEEMRTKQKSHISLSAQTTPPSFLIPLKEKFASKLINDFNYDPAIVEYLLDLHGIPANNFSLAFEYLQEIQKKMRKQEASSFEESLKESTFVRNPYVRHRFFRSRQGKSYNFYDKIKKKSENLDETKRILEQQSRRIYEIPMYEKHSTPKRNPISPEPKVEKVQPEVKEEVGVQKESHEKKAKGKMKKKMLGKVVRKGNFYEEMLYEYDHLDGSPDMSLCGVCQTKKIDIICLPCGHLCFCQDCFVQSACLICSGEIKSYVMIEGKRKLSLDENEASLD